MFGMEKKKGDTQTSFLFDLEKELHSEEFRAALAKKIETRIIYIKELLRTGSTKENFELLGTFLNGYHALAIVLAKACQEPKK